jgi:hypothetical protein
MQTLYELTRWIRDYGHDPRHLPRLIADRFVWHQIWTAVDILDDVEAAMSAYLEGEFPVDVGERYLRVYGIMQALFVQQDALKHLVGAIHPSKLLEVADDLKDICEARNASVGHPTQLNRKGMLSTHGIVQITMNKDGFELLSYPKKDDKVFDFVPVREMIEKQRAEAARILSEVVSDLKAQDEAHRVAFREKKVLKSFDQVSYAFEKIFEEVRHDCPVILGRWAVGQLQASLDQFETLLLERGLTLDSYSAIKHVYREIEHPLVELRKYVAGEPSAISSRATAVVFATALKTLFSELREVATEIDEEYSTVPDPG